MTTSGLPSHRDRTMVSSRVDPVLNYFGKCPLCGYPAHASTITAHFDDDEVEQLVVATCGLPCGWSGPVVPTTMT
ncbi:hypothetical protein F3087_11900 [Nocardia colli]|uniref:Uncharacterized protein n=1 Tax=Nocardia colli TaxID=2545717 RepID=A0A5N0EEF8_9NOCA|nr:hypothetical protein [Nocardia colli]KAA8887808.1 hypothetical protein F3087_11900 [Nocardia colli]